MLIILLTFYCIYLFYKNNYFTTESKKVSTEQEVLAQSNQLLDSGEKDQAIALLEQFLINDNDNQRIIYKLTKCYYSNGDYDKFLTFVGDNHLEDSQILNMSATIYQSRSQWDKVEECYKKALAIDPKDNKTYINFAAFYQTRGMYQQALEVVNEGLSGDNQSVSLLVTAASISIKMSQPNPAKNYLNQVMAIDPDNKQASEMLSSI